jgi:Holliday junction resolvase RusA-like endonuclease
MLCLHLPTPPSANHLFANVPGRGRVPSRECVAWKKAAGFALIAQRPIAVHGPVEIALVVEENARRDLSNHLKCVEDLLVTHNVIDGDRCKIVRKITMEWGEVEGVQIVVKPSSSFGVTYGNSPRTPLSARVEA